MMYEQYNSGGSDVGSDVGSEFGSDSEILTLETFDKVYKSLSDKPQRARFTLKESNSNKDDYKKK